MVSVGSMVGKYLIDDHEVVSSSAIVYGTCQGWPLLGGDSTPGPSDSQLGLLRVTFGLGQVAFE